MKILMIGTGVIGATYAWQLAEVGHDLEMLVRPEKRAFYEREGIHIRCQDERSMPTTTVDMIFRPTFVHAIDERQCYDLIMVCLSTPQLDPLLPSLSRHTSSADMIFFATRGLCQEKIQEWLSCDQYYFAVSQLVEGHTEGNAVICTIFSCDATRATVLGERSGLCTPRLQQFKRVLGEAGLRPVISADILSLMMRNEMDFHPAA